MRILIYINKLKQLSFEWQNNLDSAVQIVSQVLEQKLF